MAPPRLRRVPLANWLIRCEPETRATIEREAARRGTTATALAREALEREAAAIRAREI